MNSKSIEQFIYAKEIMEDIKKTLIPYYISQYGTKNKDLIEQRMKNTFYLISSTPDLIYKELKDSGSFFKSQGDYDNMITEYLDYIEVNRQLEKDKITKIRSLLCKEYSVSETTINKKDIPIERLFLNSFSSSMIALLNSPCAADDMKDEVHKLQKRYFKQCNNLGCEPITDTNIIDSILNKIKTLNTDYQVNLLKRTLWGQRLYKYFIENNGFTEGYIKSTNQEDLFYRMLQQDIFIQSGQMQCVYFTSKKNDEVYIRNNWICFPMLENMNFDLNHNFYHEMRHAVENGGIDFKKYNFINELRTDKHALEDDIALPKIFNNDGKCKSIYLPLLPLTDGLFDDFESFFDSIAISNNVNKLEMVVNKDILMEYDNMFKNTISLMINQGITDISLNINAQEYVEKSDEIAKSIKKYLVKK